VGTEAEPVVTSEEGVTQFQESSNVLLVKTAVPLDRPLTHAYPVQTPTQLIDKPYQIAQFSWNNVWPGSQIVLPYVLNAIPTIQNVLLSRFRYYRASIKLEFKLTTTQFHQGSVMVGWLPGWDSSAPPPSLQQLSGCNACVLSACTQDSLTITVPYLMPDSWIDTQQGSVSLDDRHSTVFIQPLNPLIPTAVNMPNAVTITVFASFTEIQVAGFRSHMKPNKEAHDKAKKGIDSTTVISAASRLIKQTPVGAALGIVADLVSAFTNDLSKPVSQEAPCPTIASYSMSPSLCHGLNVAEQISQYPNAEIEQSPIMGGMQTSHMTINELARKPMLFQSYTMTTMASSFSWRVAPSNIGIANDWLSHTANAFRYWRGSIKYLVHFCVPAFYSFRVRIVPTVQLTTIDNYGDLQGVIIDVKGETWYEFVVPYERPYDWSPTIGEFGPNVPIVYLDRITDIQGSSAPSSPIVYVNVFRAGGEDIQFTGLRGAREASSSITTSSSSASSGTTYRVQAHVSLEQRFKKPFEGVIKGVNLAIEQKWVMPEMAITVSDCLKRQSNHLTGGNVPGGANSTYPCVYPPGALNINYTTVGREPLNYFGSIFWFWRGGRILSHYNAGGLVGLVQQDTSSTTFGDGAAIWFNSASDANYKFTEKVQVPYYFSRPWHPISSPGHSFTVNYDVTNGPADLSGVSGLSGFLTLSGADDFVLIHPVPFFPLDVYPSASAVAGKNSHVAKKA